ncbi:hypothetical protein FE257_009691 [Aspergillus nanangensis]|uniref:Epoxide hydrolase N-terminal domain-containing protein n=1 Tax=Aspergillus nanangensis TaxID=2582783 RepID=A0AAD4CK78_ASPNN|nr:hypothetical protein FE257_009691 [Aspergillus nanangensis]
MTDITISPYSIDIPLEEVHRLRRKLLDTRLPDQPIVPGAGNDYGPPAEWFHRLYNKWLHDFDWPTIQSNLNRHAHYIAKIPDEDTTLDVHFTHTRSQREDAIPILLIHGWPGSFYEFDRVVDALVAPKSAADPAFHDHARILDRLMLGLGYPAYVAQAGDWGSFVARELGSKFPACRAVHLNFSPPPEDFVAQTEGEKLRCERSQDWLDEHLGYAVCMRTRPHTIGFAIADNPVGILAWVGEKYHELVDPERWGDPAWDGAILTQVSLYYFSGCVMTSMLPYFENVKHAEFAEMFMREENRVKVPLGYTSFLYDSRPGNQRSAKTTGNLVFYNEYNHGGHFAALECPEVILRDCRSFFGQNWNRK